MRHHTSHHHSHQIHRIHAAAPLLGRHSLIDPHGNPANVAKANDFAYLSIHYDPSTGLDSNGYYKAYLQTGYLGPASQQGLTIKAELRVRGPTDGWCFQDQDTLLGVSEIYTTGSSDSADDGFLLYIPITPSGVVVGKVKTSPISAGGSGVVEVYTDATFSTDAKYSINVTDPRTTGSDLAVGHRVLVYSSGPGLFSYIDLDPCAA
jgi:hypothetical protein